MVAQGLSQRPGFNYNKEWLYALVVWLETLRVLLSLAATLDWKTEQIDVVRAYLNRCLEEEIFMQQPEGFDDRTS